MLFKASDAFTNSRYDRFNLNAFYFVLVVVVVLVIDLCISDYDNEDDDERAGLQLALTNLLHFFCPRLTKLWRLPSMLSS